ncbi:MAG: DNA cytosine methyltransferase [Sphingobacteriales bacterium]|nr:MAG: DNA cytosine methyltransferase [Sphingobacteriales bacterium]
MNFIDLFAGAGGLSEGFVSAGFDPVAHVEMDVAASYTLKTRAAYHYLKAERQESVYYAYLQKIISRSELYSHIPSNVLSSIINLPIGKEFNSRIHKEIRRQSKGRKIDLIIGGPPCQAYSLVGRARSEDGMKKDPRNFLYVQYAGYLEEYAPKFFVFENVMGLHSANGGLYLENMRRLFKKKGYEIQLYNLEANNFGVLQHRRRVVIIGWKDNIKPDLPDLEAVRFPGDFKVKDVLSDLPKISAGEGIDRFSRYESKPSRYLKDLSIRNGVNILTQHVARPHTEQDKEIYRIAVDKWNNEGERLNYNDLPENLKTHKNRHSFFDRFKVVAEDLGFSHTVVAHISKDGHYYIHPDIEQNRSLSIREAARLQSFPDNYYFEGVKEGINRTAAFKQIGNAVPPLMASAIAEHIKLLI